MPCRSHRTAPNRTEPNRTNDSFRSITRDHRFAEKPTPGIIASIHASFHSARGDSAACRVRPMVDIIGAATRSIDRLFVRFASPDAAPFDRRRRFVNFPTIPGSASPLVKS